MMFCSLLSWITLASVKFAIHFMHQCNLQENADVYEGDHVKTQYYYKYNVGVCPLKWSPQL